jgi:hypothetical protein
MSAHTPKLPILAALATLFALLFAGCGGGSSDSTSPVAGEATSAKSEDGTRGPTTVPPKQGAKKKRAASQSLPSNTAEKDGKSKPADAGADPKATDPIGKQVKELVSGDGGTRVASSPKEIRKILRELKADAKQDGGASGSSSVEKTLEGVLGGH